MRQTGAYAKAYTKETTEDVQVVFNLALNYATIPFGATTLHPYPFTISFYNDKVKQSLTDYLDQSKVGHIGKVCIAFLLPDVTTRPKIMSSNRIA